MKVPIPELKYRFIIIFSQKKTMIPANGQAGYNGPLLVEILSDAIQPREVDDAQPQPYEDPGGHVEHVDVGRHGAEHKAGRPGNRADDGGDAPAQPVGQEARHWPRGKGDPHLERGDNGNLKTSSIEMFFELGNEDPEAVHDPVTDDITHEASKHGQPGPQTSIRSAGYLLGHLILEIPLHKLLYTSKTELSGLEDKLPVTKRETERV